MSDTEANSDGISCRVAWLTRAVAAMAFCVLHAASGQTIIDEWASVQPPPAPVLKPVTVDRHTTALLLLDLNGQSCNQQRRPRCVASIPKLKTLLDSARMAGIPVAFTLSFTAGGDRGDMLKEILPVGDEPVFSSRLDKFVDTDLEKFLKAKGVRNVIVAGTAAHGAVLYTVTGAVTRGFKVIVPVDGVSADNAYAEQYTAWHFANAPLVSPSITLTSVRDLKF